jgi:hypothetical protein
VRILGWAAWVDTETGTEIYSSADLPDDGIIYLMLYKDEGDGQEENVNRYIYKESLDGVDHYFKAPHHSGIPIYASNNEPVEAIMERYPGAVIKKGKWVPHEYFERIRLDAVATSSYVQRDTIQSAALNNYCSTVGGTIEDGRLASIGGTAGTSPFSASVAASQTDDCELSYEIVLPSDPQGDADNATIPLRFTVGHMDATLESVFICRVNSSDVNQETIGSSTGLGLSTTSGTVTPVISCPWSLTRP